MIFVNPETGDDANDGSKSAPLATGQKAVSLAKPGDTIVLLPENAIYRQSITISRRSELTIEGNGVTLDGADPLPRDGWENLGQKLQRRKIARTRWDRHLLIVGGKANRMGRTAGKNSLDLFPAAEELEEGQFRFEPIDDEQGWLIVRGDVGDLEWATRPNGIGTSGECSGLVFRDLNARHFLNDGFNIHGHVVDSSFHNIDGYDCFDEGFSAHDTCECEIEGGRFWGCEHAIADVNNCITHYRNCEFRDSVHVDVLFRGTSHSLTNCRIINTTEATALSAGPGGEKDKPFKLSLDSVEIVSKRAGNPAAVRIDGGTARLNSCWFENVALNTIGADVESSDLTLKGKWRETL
ncbi:MAG: hypothetical protein AAF585_17035 [Verrucomicrobiota bacterium]